MALPTDLHSHLRPVTAMAFDPRLHLEWVILQAVLVCSQIVDLCCSLVRAMAMLRCFFADLYFVMATGFPPVLAVGFFLAHSSPSAAATCPASFAFDFRAIGSAIVLAGSVVVAADSDLVRPNYSAIAAVVGPDLVHHRFAADSFSAVAVVEAVASVFALDAASIFQFSFGP